MFPFMYMYIYKTAPHRRHARHLSGADAHRTSRQQQQHARWDLKRAAMPKKKGKGGETLRPSTMLKVLRIILATVVTVMIDPDHVEAIWSSRRARSPARRNYFYFVRQPWRASPEEVKLQDSGTRKRTATPILAPATWRKRTWPGMENRWEPRKTWRSPHINLLQPR